MAIFSWPVAGVLKKESKKKKKDTGDCGFVRIPAELLA